MTLPYERIWAKPRHDSWDQYGNWYCGGAGGGTEYIRADIADARVAAAYEAAGDSAADAFDALTKMLDEARAAQSKEESK